MVELIHKRGWDSKVFDTGRVQVKEGEPDRPIYAAQLQNGLHDIEPNGSFVDCDPSMCDYIGNVSTLEAIRGRYGSLRAGDSESESKDRVKILTKRDCGISLKLCGHKTYGPWEDTTRKIRFDTNDGITLNYYPSYKGVNIVITVDNPQTASNIIKFSLKEYGCDYTYEEKDGNIVARSSTGKDDVYINALYATDATGDSGEVHLRLGDIVDGYQIIEKVIAPVWFGNAVGPVETDPSITIEDGVDGGVIEDALISSFSSQVTWNWGAQTFTQCYNGTLSTSQNVARFVDLSPYSGVTVLSGKYILDCTQLDASGWTVTVNPILRQWNEGNKLGAIASTGAITGNSARHNEESWASIICTGADTDYNSTVAASFIAPASLGVFDVNLTAISIQNKIDGTNNGDIFRVPFTNTASGFRTGASESANAPQFYMEYTEAAAAINKISGIFGIGRLGIR